MRRRRPMSSLLKINLIALALLHAFVYASVCLSQDLPPVLPTPAQVSDANAPLSKAWLLKELRPNRLEAAEIVQEIEKCGVDFRMTESDEQELNAEGATPAIIEAVRKNYRAPLNREELVEMLHLTRERPARTNAAQVLDEIRKRGVNFKLTKQNRAALQRAGANAAIIKAARDNYHPLPPVLPVPSTINVDPSLFPSDTQPYGDPQSSGSGTGTGKGGGMGSGTGGGVGPGDNTGNVAGGDTGNARPSGSTRVYKQSEVTKRAIITYKPPPGFTEEARKNKVNGVVRLRAVLNADGTVTNISVVSGLPYGLSERAIDAARQMKFQPAQKNGRAVSQYILLEYNFYVY
jgi:TonB family protein